MKVIDGGGAGGGAEFTVGGGAVCCGGGAVGLGAVVGGGAVWVGAFGWGGRAVGVPPIGTPIVIDGRFGVVVLGGGAVGAKGS